MKSNFLKHRIITVPRIINTDTVKPAKGALTTVADDQYYIESHKSTANGNVFLGAIIFAFGYWLFATNYVLSTLNLIFFIPGLLLICIGLFRKNQILNFV